MTWLTFGNFQINDWGIPLNRHIAYKNTQSNSSISKFNLLGYRDGHFEIAVETRTDEQFSQLVNAVVSAGLPAHSNTSLETITFSTPDKHVIGIYMRALAHQEPTMHDLMVPVANLLGLPMFDESYQLPLWYINGDFQIFNSVGSLKRQIVFSNRPNNIISIIELFGYHDGSFQIVVTTPTNEHLSQLANAIVSAGFHINLLNSWNLYNLRHSTQDKEQVIRFFQTLGNVDNTANLLIECISSILNIHAIDDFNGFEKRLEKINFPENEIPKEYCCVISLGIMSDPIYIMDCPQQKFQRGNLESWLKVDVRHPILKIAVTKNMFVSDTALISEIEVFVTQKEKEYAAASKIQHWYRHRKNIEKEALPQRPDFQVHPRSN